MTQRTNIILVSTFLLFGHICSAQTDSLYTNALKKADAAYGFKNWQGKDNPADSTKFEAAKKLYAIARKINPKDIYPESRIKEIEKILYDFKTKPVYNKLISKADSLFFTDNFMNAKIYYLKADSLYPREHSKEKLSAIYALTNLAEKSRDSILFIKRGTSFGMCDGYCYHETKYTVDSIAKVVKSWDKSEPDKNDNLKMDKSTWQAMINAINIKAFYMLPNRMGCPDCTDGGAEWLIIGTKNNEWKVEFDYGSETVTTKKLLTLIRQAK